MNKYEVLLVIPETQKKAQPFVILILKGKFSHNQNKKDIVYIIQEHWYNIWNIYICIQNIVNIYMSMFIHTHTHAQMNFIEPFFIMFPYKG